MDAAYFLHAGALVFLVGFAVRDLVFSRAVFAFAAALMAYGLAAGSGGLMGLVWAVLAIAVNLAVIWQTVTDRFTVPLTPEEQALLRELPDFSESDFRRLMRIADWQELDGPKQLTEQGTPADALYYIVTGGATVDKSGNTLEVSDNVLIGEISFTQNVPTTATVTAHDGSVLVAWPAKKLHRLLKRPSLKASFDALLAHDLAEKLAADEVRRAETKS